VSLPPRSWRRPRAPRRSSSGRTPLYWPCMGLAPKHFRHELAGGARLLTAELPDRASVSVVLMLSVGSRYEDDRIGGVSHFVEHLFFKGTPRRPTAKDIAEAIEGVGGVMNAST